jgi:hypothetical protein
MKQKRKKRGLGLDGWCLFKNLCEYEVWLNQLPFYAGLFMFNVWVD